MPYIDRIAHRLFGVPLLLDVTYGNVVLSALADKLEIEPLVDSETMRPYRRPNRELTHHRDGAFVILPIVGGVVHRGSSLNPPSGLTSYTAIQNSITDLLADNTTRGILLDIDSGGGEAAGMAELASFIREASREKPIWSIANTSACSAAYWIACASDKMFAVQHSRVGSIGVYVAHQDRSKAEEKRGVVTTLIYAGEHKVDGHPFAPLPDNVRASIQKGVDALYGDFVSYVAERRELTEDAVRKTEAAVMGPKAAKEAGLIDDIASLGDVIAAMSDYIHQPFVGYPALRDDMAKPCIYTEDDLAKAKADATAAATADSKTKLDAAVNNAVELALDKQRGEITAALIALFPDNDRLSTFLETMNDGTSVATAQKIAARIPVVAAKAPEPAPKAERTATEKDVDRVMKSASPNVSADDDTPELSDREKRLAEISNSMKYFNKASGYSN